MAPKQKRTMERLRKRIFFSYRRRPTPDIPSVSPSMSPFISPSRSPSMSPSISDLFKPCKGPCKRLCQGPLQGPRPRTQGSFQGPFQRPLQGPFQGGSFQGHSKCCQTQAPTWNPPDIFLGRSSFELNPLHLF